MTTEELPQPGVEVVQVFRATSPTVITPTLLSCVVGVCKQLLEVYETDAAGSSSLNGDALIQLPAFFEAPVGPYLGLDGANLVFSVNYGPNITVLFSDPLITGLSAATAVSQVNAALTAAGVSSVIAELVGTDKWRLRTVGIGEFQRIYIDPTTAVVCQTAFNIGLGKTYVGLTGYNQYEVTVPEASLPDPNDNLAELVIESSSIRSFLYTGASTALYEAMRDSAFLRNGVVDDVTSTASLVDIRQATLPALYAPGGTLDGTDFNIQFVDGAVINISFSEAAGHLVDETTLAARIMQVVPDVSATIGVGVPGELVLTSLVPGYQGTFTVSVGTSDALALLDPLLAGTYSGYSIEAVDDGNGDAVTPILDFLNEDFLANPLLTPAAVTAFNAWVGPMLGGETLVISDGGQEQTIIFTAAAILIADVVNEINAVIGTVAGGEITASDAAGFVKLEHTEFGTDSAFHIIGGTALVLLDPGGTPSLAVGTYRGTFSIPEPGDELWIDGGYFGLITQVAPGGLVDRLKVDTQLTINPNVGSSFFIVAKNLPNTLVPTRPDPELIVDAYGNVILKPEMLRDVLGDPVVSTAPLYLTYTAVRLDVTARAANPGLLKVDNTTELENAIAPISTDNPLALGMYFAALNAPGSQLTGLGVDEVSADAPYGTVEGFTRAAEYLEAFEVYAIAPLTHDETVAQLFNTHVTLMSEPESKGERIVLWNPDIPTYARDALVASGNDGNSSGPTGLLLDTKVTNLTTLVIAQNINPTGTIPTSEGLFLDIASDDKRYSIANISGPTVTIRVAFAAGENDDSFYSTTALNAAPLPSYLVQEQFSVKVRGAELVTVAGDPDKNAIADNIQATGRVFQNRRFWMTVPDGAAATLGGVETVVEGFYMNAATVGMISQQPPQQSFTNFPISGFTRVVGSNDFFTARQMNRMAAGGAYIIIQEAEGAPLISRMALTTDMTSIETRTDSITKVVDMVAKFQRAGLKNFIGRFNITQGFLDSLGTVLDGLVTFLTDIGVLIGANVNNIIQDEDAPDTVLIDETLDVPYPCNYIRLSLII